jgi:hypothetical protein
MSAYEGLMIIRVAFFRSLRRATAAMAVFGLGAGLCGCADMGDSFASAAFANPAKYELYDCKQLETERKALATKAAELQGLIAKAQTGAAGPVVAELAYRNEYISVRGQANLLEETWRRDRCREAAPGTVLPAAAPAPAATEKPARPRAPSASAIY